MDENSNSHSSGDSIELKSEPYINGRMETEYYDHGDNVQPYIEIIEQPQQRGFRFRYECEGPSHGGLQGNTSEKFRKTVPTIKVRNYTGPCRVIVSLVTDEGVPKPHAHKLVGKNCKEGMCVVEVRPQTPQISFPNLCIQHVTRRKAAEVLQQRIMDQMILDKQFQLRDYNCQIKLADEEKQRALKEAQKSAKDMQLNVVRLCFQVFLLDPASNNVFQMLPSVTSIGIYDSKSPSANALKICRMDKYSGCCTGNEEVFLLCEKVQREDISVRFVEQDKDGNTIWNAYGNFGPTDVHRQFAIVFKTPEYRDTDITSPVNVLVMLQRKSDKESSDPKSFTYYPKTFDEEGIKRKRMKSFPWGGGGNNQYNFDHPRYLGNGNGDKSNDSSNGDNSNGLPNGGSIPDLENLSHLQHYGGRPIRLKDHRPHAHAKRVINRHPSPSLIAASQSVDVIQNPSQFTFEEVSHLSPMSGTSQISGGASPPYRNGGSPNSMHAVSLQSVTSPYNGSNPAGSPHGSNASMSSPYHPGALSPPQIIPASQPSNTASDMMDPSKFCTQAGIGVPLTSTIADSIPETQGGIVSSVPNQMETCFPTEVTCENFVQPVQPEQAELETDFFPGQVQGGIHNYQFYNQYSAPQTGQSLSEIEHELAAIVQMYGGPQTCAFQARGANSTNYIQGLDDITGLDFFDGKRNSKAIPSQGLDEPDCALFKAPTVNKTDYEQMKVKDLQVKDSKHFLQSPTDQEILSAPTATVTIDTQVQTSDSQTKHSEAQTDMDPTLRIVTKTAEALQQYAATGDVRVVLMVQRFLMTLSDSNGDLPLHTSLINEKYEVFQNLLDVMVTLPDYQARINMYNFLHQTPLHLAVITNQPYAIDLLLRAGADPTLVDRNGNTPAHLAVLYKRDQCLKTLLRYLRPNVSAKCPFPELNMKSFDGYTPAHLAAQVDNLAAMKLLVYGKADVNLPDGKSGKTPLHHVVEADELSIAAYLILQAEADPNKKSFDGNTALHIACGRGNVGMVALLMAGGADPNIENDEYESDGSDKEDNSDNKTGQLVDADKDTDASEEVSDKTGLDEVDGREQNVAETRRGHGLRPEDLADCNQKILRILNGEPYTSLKEEEREKEEEDKEIRNVSQRFTSLKLSPGHESGLGSLGLTSIKGDMFRVDYTTRKSLSDLLDKCDSGADWQALADRLGLKNCMTGTLGELSPTRTLLTYYEENGGTVSGLTQALQGLKREDAAQLLTELESSTSLSPGSTKDQDKDECLDSGLDSIQNKSST